MDNDIIWVIAKTLVQSCSYSQYDNMGRGQRIGGLNEHSTKNDLVSCDFVWAVR